MKISNLPSHIKTEDPINPGADIPAYVKEGPYEPRAGPVLPSMENTTEIADSKSIPGSVMEINSMEKAQSRIHALIIPRAKLTRRSSTTAPFKRIGTTRFGCIIVIISLLAIFKSIVALITFRPPLVDPAVAPMAIRIRMINLGNSCQEPQSAVL